MSDTEIKIRSLKADIGSEQMHSSALETALSRVRVVLSGDASDSDKLSQVQSLAYGVVGAPDLPA